MKSIHQLHRIVLAASLAFAGTFASAAPVFMDVAVAQETRVDPTDPSPSAPRAPQGAPVERLGEFEALITDIKNESFGSVPKSGAFGNSSLDLSASIGAELRVLQPGGETRVGEVVDSGTDFPIDGRFDTTGDANKRWWLTSNAFVLDFGAAGVNALGFYATDVGDFRGSFEIELVRANGDGTTTSVTQVFMPGQNSASSSTPSANMNNGWLQFFAFYDPEGLTYNQVIFRIGQQSGLDPDDYDYLGFDDFVVGTFESGGGGSTPEPGSLALVGAALLGVTAARRRKA